ncbi:MAG TPA: hypothetical protein PK431_10535 [Chitinophagales bacterium]|nr:hypothetical protein [Chitinophagales bacterium]
MKKILLIIFIAITSNSYCSDWIFLAFYKDYTIWYKTPAITFTTGAKKVWVKQTYTDEAVKTERKNLIYKDKDKPNYSYQKYSYSLFLYEFDCDNSTNRYLERIDYTEDGTSLNHKVFEYASTDNIVPNTAMENIFNEVCGN